MTNMLPIQMTGVCKAFEERQVLAGATLTVPEGTVLGLLGTNAAGKTTLIKCLLGLLKPQAGDCKIFGEKSWDLSAATKARIGYVPQIITLYPWMRVRQLVDYTASFYPHWNDGLVQTRLENWAISPNDKIKPLSVGQMQRLAIALALGHEPDLLVLDEPAASLDPLARREFLQIIIDLAVPGKRTVLFSTHITSDLERVADQVAILKDGKIAFQGLLDNLKDGVQRLHISANKPLAGRLGIPGTLHERVDGLEAFVSVRGLTEDLVAETAQRLEATINVEPLNLEEIFLEMHGGAP